VTALVAWAATLGIENPLHKILVAGAVGLCLYIFLNRRDISPLIPAKILSRLSRANGPRTGKGRYRRNSP